MFDYKNAQFYTDYFSSLEGFSLLEEFKDSEDEKEKNLYVGSVEVLNTIHPLVLRVEIPFTFPHNKLVFRTKSLSGYPHLIHNGKIEYGDWFCLNTPFAETPEEQLNQEITRLKEWISHQMREDLPAIIKDANVKKALAFANAYEWENLDEVKEFSSIAIITFVGQEIQLRSSYKELTGYFDCVKSPDNRIYAFSHNIDGTNYKLPYIIVKEVPENVSILEDFLLMKDFYGWDEETCHHLLSKSNYKSAKNTFVWSSPKYEVEYTEEQALNIANDVISELEKEESYLDKKKTFIYSIIKKEQFKETIRKKIPPCHKKLIIEELKEVKKEIITNNGIKYIEAPWHKVSEELMTEEEEKVEDWVQFGQYVYDYFVVGFEHGKEIQWVLFFTNPASIKNNQISYDIKIRTININSLVSIKMDKASPQYITKEMFFGRGALCPILAGKHIALVGLGAIGSIVADVLTHSGIQYIGLWDGDIVEPGNICRSSYQLRDLGQSKVDAIKTKIQSINPFVNISEVIPHGYWSYDANFSNYVNGTFYGNVNYNNQEEAVKQLDNFDLIIDCTGSNEMLHFLSYAASNIDIISMCITNHANDLLCITNKDGNPFELRKAYLSRIEQDTKNFYIEGEGCYSPTFLANNCDIASLVNLALRDLNLSMDKGTLMHSTIYSYSERGIIADRISTYKLEGYDITLNVSKETLYDAEEMNDSADGAIGYIFGSYSKDGKQVMITHIVDALNAEGLLSDAFETSKGLIDYIGDYHYSGEKSETYSASSFELIASKAEDCSINTNNPLLAVRNPDGSITFFLYINNELVKFSPMS
ncbi:HesA/MoeB/ThiF family protein [Leyella stercorea]|uniref:HesA/MoeB/ThiF family protein n=1 Tax=Leyella stercorea TaxID=363265 RepID=UPI002432B9F3|nr:ThiF family adenylyltransferase [Leyella stercorea]